MRRTFKRRMRGDLHHHSTLHHFLSKKRVTFFRELSIQLSQATENENIQGMKKLRVKSNQS